MSVRALYLTSYTQAAPVNPTPFVHSVVWLRKSSTVPPCAGGSSTAQIPAELIAHCCSSPPAAQRNLPSSAPSLEALCFVGVQAEPQLCGLAVAVPQQVVWGFSPEPILHHPVPTGPPAWARVIALKDQWGLSHVELRQESAILKGRCIQDKVSFLFLWTFPNAKRVRGPLLQRHAPTSPKTISELNLCTGFALSWQQHTSHYHKQQETIQVFAAWHHPTHHH